MERIHPSLQFRSILAPLGGLLAALSVLVLFNFQYVTAQLMLWLQPGGTYSQSAPAQAEALSFVSPEPLLQIPKINVSAPTVYGMSRTDEPSIQSALEKGVLHFASTPLPNQQGNGVYVGHSSNNVWAPGDYKFIFALLDRLEVGDTYSLHYKNVRYDYKVVKKWVASPNDVSVLAPTEKPSSTLITCTPVGTNTNRLIIRGELISPATLSDETSQTTRPIDISNLPGSN